MSDSYGDGWTGNILSIDNQSYSISCMWPNCNYETVQVNTCLGCIDELACKLFSIFPRRWRLYY